MRINAPVTDKELDIAEGSMIVSKTDTKGRIAYVNRDFIDISGFTEDELIGQAHNIVRHPGMPPEAFADMWRSLKDGRPWIGMVKNRCKNGDHYWVQANVTPLRENGVVTGYMSVRTKPTRAQIDAAASAYAEIINGNPRKLAIHRGQVVNGKSWFSGRGQSLGVRLGVIAAVAGLVIGAVDAAGAAGLLNNWFASIAAECAGAGLIGYLVWRLHRDTVSELEATRAWLYRMAEGDLRTAPVIKREDEIGAVMESALSLQIKVGFDIEDMARMSAEHRRIGMALENSEAHVMIADETGKVIYLNSTLRKMFERNAEQLRKSLPEFDPGKLLGANIDVFHRDPKHQRRIIDGLKDSHRAEVKVSGLIFSLVASPVFDARARRVGTVVEWKDLTAIKGEIGALVGSAAAGDFSMRGNPMNHSGEFRDFVVMLNKLMESADTGISATADVLNKLADGDLSARVHGEMEGRFKDLQHSTNTTLDRLSGIVRQIHEASGIINVAAKEIASGNTDLSQRTEEQASSLEQTAAALEELSSTVKLNAENARHANQYAVNASAVAGKGGDVVRQVVHTMGDISQSSKKIADIIGVIDGIAFQTNILALNAAVEAARAGEQGRGFAVVATEVRNLAQRSANAAKEIKQLIENSVGTVDAGSKLVNDAGTTMDEVVAAVKQVTEFMSEITTASQEQSGGIEQVNQAIMQMDEVTQQNAAMVEQAAAAAESLEEQAGVLVHSVSVFKVAANDASLAAPASVKERRGANRAKNVARISAGNKAVAKAKGGAATGTDGWENY